MEKLQKQYDMLPDHERVDWIKKEVTDEQIYTIEIEKYWSDHPEPLEPVQIKAEKELEDPFGGKSEMPPKNCHPEQFPDPEMRQKTAVVEKSHTESSNLKKPEYVEMDRQLAMEKLQKQRNTLPDHESVDWIKKEVPDEQIYTIEIEKYWSEHPDFHPVPTEPGLIRAEKGLKDYFDGKPERPPKNCHPEQFPTSEMKQQSTVTELPEKPRTALNTYISENLKKPKYIEMDRQLAMKKLRKQWYRRPDHEKLEWINKAFTNEQRYMIEIKKYCSDHPDFHPETMKPALTKAEKELRDRFDGKIEMPPKKRRPETEMKQQSTVTEGPEKPRTALSIYISENLKKSKFADQQLARKRFRKQWYRQSDLEKLEWINKAVTDEERYMIEIKKYCSDHPDFHPETMKPVLTKAEKELKDRFDKKVEMPPEESDRKQLFKGEPKKPPKESDRERLFKGQPKKPPKNGYSLFFAEMISILSDVHPKDRMSESAKRWNDMVPADRDSYSKRHQDMMRKYNMDMEEFLKNLSPEEAQEFQKQEETFLKSKKCRVDDGSKIEIEKYWSDHPDFQQEPVEPVLYEAEKELKDGFDEKPDRSPKSMELKEQKREEHNLPEQKLNVKHKENYDVYLSKFPEKEREKIENEDNHDLSNEELKAVFCFQKEKFTLCQQKLPHLSSRDIMRILADVYKYLSENEKDKYRKIVEEAQKVNNESSSKKRKCLPEQFPSPKKRQQSTVTEGPEKPNSPSSIYISENLKEPEYVELDRRLAVVKLQEQWKTLSDHERIEWIKKAITDEQRYTIEIEKYCSDHPDFHPEPIKPVLTIAEKRLKDIFDKKLPFTGYRLFYHSNLYEIKDIPSKLNKEVISMRWKELNDVEREKYGLQASKLNVKHPQELQLMTCHHREKFAICQQKHPDLSKEDIMKVLTKEYDDLDEDEKDKYRKILEEADRKRSCEPKQFPTPEMKQQSTVNGEPEKPHTALGIYISENLKKPEYVEMDRQLAMKKLRKQWYKRPDHVRVEWINKAVTDEQRYKIEIEKYCKNHPDFHPEPVKPVLTNVEKSLKDRFDGKIETPSKKDAGEKWFFKGVPSKPPMTGYSLFYAETYYILDDIEHKNRMSEIAKRWKNMVPADRNNYKRRVQNMKWIYNKDMKDFLSNLSPVEAEEFKKYEENFLKPKVREKRKVDNDSKIEIGKYWSDHPDFHHEPIEPMLSKAEKESEDPFDGKLEGQPKSGISLFAHTIRLEIKGISSKLKLADISRRWKELKEHEREEYNLQAQKLNTKYKENYAVYLSKLPEREREKIENEQDNGKKAVDHATFNIDCTKEDMPELEAIEDCCPKKPLSAMFYFQKENFAVCQQKHPNLSKQNVMKILAIVYNDLPEKNKDKYRKMEEEAKKAHDEGSTGKR